MKRVLLAATLVASLSGTQLEANEPPRVLAVTGRSIADTNIAPDSFSDAQLTRDGGAWFLAHSRISCSDIFCSLPPGQRVSLLEVGDQGQGRSAVGIGGIGGGFFIGTDQDHQLVVDSQRRYGAYTTGTTATPTGLRSFRLAEPEGQLIAEANNLFVDISFAREIGVGKPDEVYYSGQFQQNQAIDAQNDTGIWRVDSNGTTPIVREGLAAPDVPGAILGSIGALSRGPNSVIVIGGPQPPVASFASSRGGITFQAEIDIPGFDSVNEQGLWVNRGDQTELVTRTSLQAPGTSGRKFWVPTNSFGFSFNPPRAFSEPVITDSGDVVFAGNTGSRQEWDGIWRQTADGSLEAVVVTHTEVAPAARPEDRTGRFTSIGSFDASDSGHVVFTGAIQLEQTIPSGNFSTITVTNENGVWLNSPDGETELVAISQSDPITGNTSALYRDPHVNAAGQALFRSETVPNPDGDAFPVEWVTALDRDGTPVEIIRRGDQIDVGDLTAPDLRTVSSFEISDFDDAGRVLIEAQFEDFSTALLVSEAVAAPSIHGDYNGDGVTDLADYAHWRSTYGMTVRVGDGADGNLNGVIDAGDYTAWRDRLPSSAGPATAVPEPSGLLLLAISAAGAVARRSPQ